MVVGFGFGLKVLEIVVVSHISGAGFRLPSNFAVVDGVPVGFVLVLRLFLVEDVKLLLGGGVVEVGPGVDVVHMIYLGFKMIANLGLVLLGNFLQKFDLGRLEAVPVLEPLGLLRVFGITH